LTQSLRTTVRQFGPLLAGQTLSLGSYLVDTVMAARLGSRAVSTLTYGSRVVNGVVGLGGMPLSMALFPHFSILAAHREWSELRRIWRTMAALVLVLSAVGAAVLIALRVPIFRLFLQRGMFTAADTARVARFHSWFALQIPFHLLAMMGARVLSASARNQLVMWAGGVNLVLNILGNVILIRFMGLDGIALSTSVVLFVSCLTVSWMVAATLKARSAQAQLTRQS
jgi:putative peptidoglycan lipid II flippase